jgi:hypothetical protein
MGEDAMPMAAPFANKTPEMALAAQLANPMAI